MGEVVIAVVGLVSARLGLDYIHIMALDGWDELDWQFVIRTVFDAACCVGRQGDVPGWDYYRDNAEGTDNWVFALEVNMTREGSHVNHAGRADG